MRVIPSHMEKFGDEDEYKKVVELKTIRPTALCVRDELRLQLVSCDQKIVCHISFYIIQLRLEHMIVRLLFTNLNQSFSCGVFCRSSD